MHLQNKVKRLLDDLFDFMDEVNQGLDQEVVPGDVPTLRLTLGFIRRCKNRHDVTVTAFEPVNEVCRTPQSHRFSPMFGFSNVPRTGNPPNEHGDVLFNVWWYRIF